MERAAAQCRYEALHEKAPWHDGTHESWAAKRSDEFPYHRDDGVNIWAAPQDLNPDDDFLKTANRDDDESGGVAEHVPDSERGE